LRTNEVREPFVRFNVELETRSGIVFNLGEFALPDVSPAADDVREGAQRPMRPSDCNGRVGRHVQKRRDPTSDHVVK